MYSILKKTILTAMAMGLLAGPAFASDKEDTGDHKDHRDMRKEMHGKDGDGKKMAEELGLDAEQKKKMKEIHKSFKETRKGMKDELKAAHEAMKVAMENPNSSEADLRARHEAMKAVMQKKGDARFEKMLAIRAILNPEQIKKMSEMHKKHKDRRQGMGGPGGMHEGMGPEGDDEGPRHPDEDED